MNRCKWCSTNNIKYIKYHDEEWGKETKDEHYLYEMFILETFVCGLSWEIILNKRDAFITAFDNFDISKVSLYQDEKINELMNNKDIVRNKLKIKASISNSKIYQNIIKEYITFYNYLTSFFLTYPIIEIGKTTNTISEAISKDLISRGMKFVGPTTIYSYLQAIGLIYSHEEHCFLYRSK